MAPDGRLYNSGRKGELFELRAGLNAVAAKDRKTALKRVVAAMTQGKDVSSLFADVVKNTASDLAMKKLVYLYIIHYAHSQPDLAILVVNTFLKDCADPFPLVRALAIRTMALIPLEGITEYLCDPLRAALSDSDPYVQKTAAICVAKLYDTNPTLVVEERFIEELQSLLGAGNPMTVANAIAALSEIAEASGKSDLLELSPSTVPRYLAALSECTEWGQTFILDALSNYDPVHADEADAMVERIIPRLQHSNPGVVLSAVRILIRLLPRLDSDSKRDFLRKKMGPPLLSLLTGNPEMQFVALRNLSLLANEHSDLLDGDIRMFFVSYSDPLYVKIEKLSILVKLARETNADGILRELREYTEEVEIPFVRRAVACIGRVTVAVSTEAERGVSILTDLLKTRAPHIVEEAAVALADVLRMYPGRFEATIAPLCEVSELIEDPAARSALVWILGEHASRIPNVMAMLDEILQTLPEETAEVQLSILSACFKTFLTRGDEAVHCFQRCIEYSTRESGNLDVRDRGFMYARLAQADPQKVAKVLLSAKPGIQDESHVLPRELLEELVGALSSVASVYHKPVASFRGVRQQRQLDAGTSTLLAEEDLLGLGAEGDASFDSIHNGDHAAAANGNSAVVAPKKDVAGSLLDELFGESKPTAAPVNTPPKSNGTFTDIDNLGLEALTMNPGLKSNTAAFQDKLLMQETKGRGLLIRGGMIRTLSGQIALSMTLSNKSRAPMSSFAIQFNKNAFALQPSAPLRVREPLRVGASEQVQVPMQVGADADLTKATTLQIAVKFTSAGSGDRVVYFAEKVVENLDALLEKDGGHMEKEAFLDTWQSLPDSTETTQDIQIATALAKTPEAIVRKLLESRIFLVAKRSSQGNLVLYVSAKVTGPWQCMIMSEFTIPPHSIGGVQTARLASRCILGAAGRPFLEAFGKCVQSILNR